MIELIDLCKSYIDGINIVNIFDDVNFVFEENHIYSILGSSGCGKSTLMNVISTLIEADSGKIIISGQNILQLNSNKKADFRLNNFGFIFQSYHLIPTLTSKENIILPSVFKKKDYDNVYYNYLTDSLGITELENKLPNKLSGGEQQRVAIARAMLLKPRVIFADEPTGNLDKENELYVQKILFEYAKETKCTLIYVTHNCSFADMADTILTIEDNKVKYYEDII